MSGEEDGKREDEAQHSNRPEFTEVLSRATARFRTIGTSQVEL